jgi:hypothetical protein
MIFDMSGEGPELVHVVESRPLEADDTPYRRRLAAGASNTFWTVDRATYRVVHRDSEGRTLNEIRRTPDWAPDGGGVSGYGPATEPPARMDAIHQDSLGRVWVLSRTPRADWRDAWARRGITDLPDGDVAIDGPSSSELWNSRLEVFSAGLDSLLGSDIIPGVFDGFISDGRLHRYNESEIGIPIIELVEVSLGDRSGPGSS